MSALNDRTDIVYFSTKTWEHVVSTAFRQHLADSHCQDTHGYALTVKAVFGAYKLDRNNWVVDFGGLKDFKWWLEKNFDHKHLIAEDDPLLSGKVILGSSVRPVVATGCEAIARMMFEYLEGWIEHHYKERVWLQRLEVAEHEGNSAYVEREKYPHR